MKNIDTLLQQASNIYPSVINRDQFDKQNLKKYENLMQLNQNIIEEKTKIDRIQSNSQLKKLKKDYLLYMAHKKDTIQIAKGSYELSQCFQSIQRKIFRKFFDVIKKKNIENINDYTYTEDRGIIIAQIKHFVKAIQTIQSRNRQRLKKSIWTKLKQYSFKKQSQIIQDSQKIQQRQIKQQQQQEQFQTQINNKIKNPSQQQNKDNQLKIQKENRQETLKSLKIYDQKIQKTKNSLEEQRQKLYKIKVELHDQITHEIQAIKIDENCSQAMLSQQLNTSQQSLSSLFCELVGENSKKCKKDVQQVDQQLAEDYVMKSRMLEEKLDEIRELCEQTNSKLGHQLSQIQRGLITQTLRFLELKPLGTF